MVCIAADQTAAEQSVPYSCKDICTVTMRLCVYIRICTYCIYNATNTVLIAVTGYIWHILHYWWVLVGNSMFIGVADQHLATHGRDRRYLEGLWRIVPMLIILRSTQTTSFPVQSGARVLMISLHCTSHQTTAINNLDCIKWEQTLLMHVSLPTWPSSRDLSSE